MSTDFRSTIFSKIKKLVSFRRIIIRISIYLNNTDLTLKHKITIMEMNKPYIPRCCYRDDSTIYFMMLLKLKGHQRDGCTTYACIMNLTPILLDIYPQVYHYMHFHFNCCHCLPVSFWLGVCILFLKLWLINIWKTFNFQILGNSWHYWSVGGLVVGHVRV